MEMELPEVLARDPVTPGAHPMEDVPGEMARDLVLGPALLAGPAQHLVQNRLREPGDRLFE